MKVVSSLTTWFVTGLCIASLSLPSQAEDWTKPLPDSPPPSPKASELKTAGSQLKANCSSVLSLGQGLSETKPKAKVLIRDVCACITRNMLEGKNLEQIQVIAATYKGEKLEKVSDEIRDLYIHHAIDLEHECKLKPAYQLVPKRSAKKK